MAGALSKTSKIVKQSIHVVSNVPKISAAKLVALLMNKLAGLNQMSS